MNITWTFHDGGTGAVTAAYGRQRLTQYPGGRIVMAGPGETDEEAAFRRRLFDRAAATGKIWVEEAACPR